MGHALMGLKHEMPSQLNRLAKEPPLIILVGISVTVGGSSAAGLTPVKPVEEARGGVASRCLGMELSESPISWRCEGKLALQISMTSKTSYALAGS
jgi:hypothetical protein